MRRGLAAGGKTTKNTKSTKDASRESNCAAEFGSDEAAG
jgi:hypothetical protein